MFFNESGLVWTGNEISDDLSAIVMIPKGQLGQTYPCIELRWWSQQGQGKHQPEMGWGEGHLGMKAAWQVWEALHKSLADWRKASMVLSPQRAPLGGKSKIQETSENGLNFWLRSPTYQQIVTEGPSFTGSQNLSKTSFQNTGHSVK